MSSVEEGGPDQTGRRGTWWSATVQWRNWPLLVKLGMVLVVPVVSALVLGVLRVSADVELADSYARIERVANLREQFVSVLSAVQYERNEAVRPGGRFQLDLLAEVTDNAVNSLTDEVRREADVGGAETGYAAVARALESLPAARRQVTDGADGMVVLSAYNAVVNTVLEFDRSLVGRFPDENLAGTSIALSELLGMREQVALEQAIGNLALRDGVLPDAARQLLVEADVRFDDKLDDFRSQAPPTLVARYESAAKSDSMTEFQQMVDAVRTTDPAALPFDQSEWEATSGTVTDVTDDLTQQAASALRADSAELADSISDRAGLESVLLLTMVLLAAGIGGGLGRYLLTSVGLLRRTALDVAERELPEAVASIRAGEGSKVKVEPVPLKTTEEFGQLARAFDAVHAQAVRSAAEEASLRSNLANIFTNLSRRSQGLVERQLRLMEQLEQKADDPEQLESLFKIDHLATRMRRNNENLMVLSGTGLLRRFSEPMPLPDVLRAAISEVEHYQRAVVRSVPDVRVAGYAAGDLIRSVSELIENATAFSPPDAQVTVTSRLLADGSAVIDILDEGVGMGEKELREANEKITGGGGVDVPISRQMGLFVVGRLTARHGIHVRLVPRTEGGLSASVLVPPGLVAIGDPGQTASIEVVKDHHEGPATATEWLNAATVSMPAVSWPTAVPETRASSWLSAAKKPDKPAAETTRSGLASTWLIAAKKAETGASQGGRHTADDTGHFSPEAPVWTTDTADPTPLPTRTSGAADPISTSLPTRTPGAATDEFAQPSATDPAASGLPTRTPGAAADALAHPRGTTEPSLPGRTPGAAADTSLSGRAPGAATDTPATDPAATPLPTRTPGAATDEFAQPSATDPAASGLPTRTPGAAADALAHPRGTTEPSLPGRTPGTATDPLAHPSATTERSLPGRTPAADPAAAEPPTSRPQAASTHFSPVMAESSAAPLPVRKPNVADAPAVPTEGEPLDESAPPLPVRKPGAAARSLGPLPLAGMTPGRLPHEVFEPVEVAGRLETAGIVVTLPDLPDATTPASILFADNTAGGDGGEAGFSWLRDKAVASATATQQPVAPVVTTGPAGLPKRVPKGQLQGSARAQSQPQPTANRDPARARGFLSGFQAGIRQSEDRKGETSS